MPVQEEDAQSIPSETQHLWRSALQNIAVCPPGIDPRFCGGWDFQRKEMIYYADELVCNDMHFPVEVFWQEDTRNNRDFVPPDYNTRSSHIAVPGETLGPKKLKIGLDHRVCVRKHIEGGPSLAQEQGLVRLRCIQVAAPSTVADDITYHVSRIIGRGTAPPPFDSGREDTTQPLPNSTFLLPPKEPVAQTLRYVQPPIDSVPADLDERQASSTHLRKRSPKRLIDESKKDVKRKKGSKNLYRSGKLSLFRETEIAQKPKKRRKTANELFLEEIEELERSQGTKTLVLKVEESEEAERTQGTETERLEAEEPSEDHVYMERYGVEKGRCFISYLLTLVAFLLVTIGPLRFANFRKPTRESDAPLLHS